jgi:hypothetical protein
MFGDRSGPPKGARVLALPFKEFPAHGPTRNSAARMLQHLGSRVFASRSSGHHVGYDLGICLVPIGRFLLVPGATRVY